MNFFYDSNFYWYDYKTIKNKSFKCGHCGDRVSSNRGYPILEPGYEKFGDYGGIYICSNCNGATFFTPRGDQLPGETLGNKINNVPENLDNLYNEARRCFSNNCYTATVMLCRKMLMNIAVSQGASTNMNFFEYVTYLSENNYTPPKSEEWVDYIRQKGNEANHEIEPMSQQDAKNLLIFIEMILKFVYEFPSMITE